MIEIKDLLLKFTNMLSFGEGRVEVVQSVISEIIGVQIKKEDIKIKNNIVYLNIKPIYKNEVFLKRGQIFTKLKESLGDKTPQDIR